MAKMRTEIFTLALVMVVALGATAMPAMAATEGSSSGSFDLGNAAPTVTAITLRDSTDANTVDYMDPTTEYIAKIEVSDINTLNDLSEIKVIIRTIGTSADDVNDQATYKWTNGATPEWTKVGPAGLWSLESGSTWHTPLTDTSGTWELHFKPGPVAKEGTDNWEIYAKATDKASPGLTGELITVTKYDMHWRGEISIVSGYESYSFGNIGLGDINMAIIGDGKIDITAISNGNYKLDSLTTAKWNCADPVDDVDLDSTGACSNPGEFALKVNDGSATATYGLNLA